MGTVSTVTIGSYTYDVYGTTTEIKTYLGGRLGTDDYDDASSADRNKAHVQGTMWIDSLKWSGLPYDLTTPQPLQFPRTGLVDSNGQPVDPETLPDQVVYCCAELILVILAQRHIIKGMTLGALKG